MSSLEQYLHDEAAKLRKGLRIYSPTANLLERAAREIKHLHDLLSAYQDMARDK